MTALCLVAAEIPFLLCSLVFYRELSEKGLYKTVFGCAKRYTSKTKNAP